MGPEKDREGGVKQFKTACRSPWQSPFAERIIGSIRRDCLDHVIVFNENHVRSILKSYLDYFRNQEALIDQEREELWLSQKSAVYTVFTPERLHKLNLREFSGSTMCETSLSVTLSKRRKNRVIYCLKIIYNRLLLWRTFETMGFRLDRWHSRWRMNKANVQCKWQPDVDTPGRPDGGKDQGSRPE